MLVQLWHVEQKEKRKEKLAVRKHYPTCCPQCRKGDRTIQVKGKALALMIHSLASENLRNICALMRDDAIKRTVMSDELVVQFGNLLSEKYDSGEITPHWKISNRNTIH